MTGRRHLLAARRSKPHRFFKLRHKTITQARKYTRLGNWQRLRQDHSDGPDTTVHIV